jgi:SRSO17 transposase
MRMDAIVVQGWACHFEQLIGRIGVCFGRRDLRRRAGAYVRGLLGPVRRKNGWQLAEHVGDATPYGLQRLLDRASWDADAVRDELVGYTREHLLTERDPGVLIVDETGFLKKGDKSVGPRGRAASILGHGGADRELSGRRVPGVGGPAWPGVDRSRVVSA